MPSGDGGFCRRRTSPGCWRQPSRLPEGRSDTWQALSPCFIQNLICWELKTWNTKKKLLTERFEILHWFLLPHSSYSVYSIHSLSPDGPMHSLSGAGSMCRYTYIKTAGPGVDNENSFEPRVRWTGLIITSSMSRLLLPCAFTFNRSCSFLCQATRASINVL